MYKQSKNQSLVGATVKLSATGATRISMGIPVFGLNERMLKPEEEGVVTFVGYTGDGQTAVGVESKNDPSQTSCHYSMDELEVVKYPDNVPAEEEPTEEEIRQMVESFGGMLGEALGMDVEVHNISQEDMEGLISGDIDEEEYLSRFENDSEDFDEDDEEIDFEALEEAFAEDDGIDFEIINHTIVEGSKIGGKDTLILVVATNLPMGKKESLMNRIVENMEFPESVEVSIVYV